MPKCNICGGEIIFRYMGGVLTPVHLSGRCSHGSIISSISKGIKIRPKQVINHDSYTNPHARCPKCGEEVFYYQSASGGRVFFDELGPPWPKHPCTDNPNISKKVIISSSNKKHGNTEGKKYGWQKAGWEPFYTLKIEQVHNDKYLSCHGLYKGKEIVIYIKNKVSFDRSSPIHLRIRDNESYDMSTISVVGEGQPVDERKYIAYKTLQLAHLRAATKVSSRAESKGQSYKRKQKSTKKRSRKEKLKPRQKTALEIAFEEAKSKG